MTEDDTPVEPQGAISIAPYRYALCIEYTGTCYKGWQSQKNAGVATVQGCVEQALSTIANEPISIVCAGRTDAGVHGTYQIIHFDTHAVRSARGWVMGGNTKLPSDIAIRWAKQVDSSFHARFSALQRRYRYLIYSSSVMPGVLPHGVTWTYKKLDVDKMREGAAHLMGEHDFTSYRAVGCQAKSPVRQVQRLDIYTRGQILVLDISANAFLHHMVRNIAGVLMTIGAGEAEPLWAKEVLEAKDRRAGGITAPPFGLYFVDVTYPQAYNLPKSEIGPFFLGE